MLKKIATWALALSLVLGFGFGSTLRAADDAAKGAKPEASADAGTKTTSKKHHKKHKHHKKAASEEPAAAPSK